MEITQQDELGVVVRTGSKVRRLDTRASGMPTVVDGLVAERNVRRALTPLLQGGKRRAATRARLAHLYR